MAIGELLVLASIGLFGGIFGGLLGIGGSVIILPGLIIVFGQYQPVEYQHIYQATAMLLTIFVTAPAAWWHFKQKVPIWNMLKYLIPAALISMIIGVWLSNLPMFAGDGALILRRMLGIFLLYVMGYNLYRLIAKYRLPDPSEQEIRKLAGIRTVMFVGLPMGLLGGLLGIGGGSVCVPFQQIILKLPLRRAIANSAVTIFCIEIFAASYKVMTLPDASEKIYALKLAAALIPTCLIGGLLGAKLTYLLPRNVIRTVFCLLMLYVGVSFALNINPIKIFFSHPS